MESSTKLLSKAWFLLILILERLEEFCLVAHASPSIVLRILSEEYFCFYFKIIVYRILNKLFRRQNVETRLIRHASYHGYNVISVVDLGEGPPALGSCPLRSHLRPISPNC